MSMLARPHFRDEEKAVAYLEGVVWADGKVCPPLRRPRPRHEGEGEPGQAHSPRPVALWRWGDCKKQFAVKLGTLFEHARLPLNKALQGVYLMTSRVLEVTYNTACFLAHRIREAMPEGDLAPFGLNGEAVEVDETYIGRTQPSVPCRQGQRAGQGDLTDGSGQSEIFA